MRLYPVLLALACAVAAAAQTQNRTPILHVPPGGSSTIPETTNLPVERIGNDDLLGITVYDEPELTRTVRVNSEGDIRLPMLRKPIHASGLYPADLETTITKALGDEQVMVDPIVTVSVVEYRSRPIKVVGAVNMPLTFQSTGQVTLLDAIARAQGLSEHAGSDILISRWSSANTDADPKMTLIKRVPVKELLSGDNPSLNIRLDGGEEVRIPEAGKVYVVGNVKKPGPYFIADGPQSSVMKALSESQGLDSFSSHKAYIYRVEGASGGRSEIPIDLKKIMDRKTPDVALMDNDILYIPTANGVKSGMKVLEISVTAAATIGAASIYAMH